MNRDGEAGLWTLESAECHGNRLFDALLCSQHSQRGVLVVHGARADRYRNFFRSISPGSLHVRGGRNAANLLAKDFEHISHENGFSFVSATAG